eukprot:TRINITY_DN19_c5_g1_i1.p1 TRINITY_DN19_c5_g1~~TRINITY_DN19_c5_g1_i1.p1  ORF type:complete len:136 (+),score=27.71 TRINITY_DN19_c5_g1_i1:62-469(+)
MRRGIVAGSSSASPSSVAVSIGLPPFSTASEASRGIKRRGCAVVLGGIIVLTSFILLVLASTSNYNYNASFSSTNEAPEDQDLASMDSIFKGIKSMYQSKQEGSPFAELETIDGEKVSVSDYLGKVSLIVNVASF